MNSPAAVAAVSAASGDLAMPSASSRVRDKQPTTRLCQASARRARLPLQVAMISLGCAKNLVDAEIMLGSVLKCGMKVTSRADEADVLVVNTCAFIDSAKEESIEAILEAHQQCGLTKRPDQKLIVSGCLSQRFASELRHEMPEVDAFIGLDQVAHLGEIVEKVLDERRTLNAQRPMPKPDSWALGVRSSAFDVSSENDETDLAFANTRPTYIPDYDTP